jgi:glycosyltransferase involved in cell wall biosynthesis
LSSNKKVKIGILGTRGIPNNYGGFEQFAEYLSLNLVKRGVDISVYNSHNHPYRDSVWQGIHIIHKFDPEYKVGTVGQFVYDLFCILDSRRRNFDLILQLGYTSSSLWNFLLPKKSVILTNMDGLEWKRTKYSRQTQRFLKYAERLAVKRSDYLISDSLGIKKYLKERHGVDSTYIPYGAEVFKNLDAAILEKFNLVCYKYDMLIARLEPENSIEMILDGRVSSKVDRKFIVVANFQSKFGQYLVDKYKDCGSIIFLGSIYDINILNNFRYYSNLYFHGHTVGGTNPSLLEAMASGALIAANENDFNMAILERDAYYFRNSNEVTQLLDKVIKNDEEGLKVQANLIRISSLYSWKKISDSYLRLFEMALLKSRSK